jgi:hypothetical protein
MKLTSCSQIRYRLFLIDAGKTSGGYLPLLNQRADYIGATYPSLFLSYREAPCTAPVRKKVSAMFLILAVVLFIVWIGSFLAFKTAGILIHLLLLFAILSIVMHFISGKRAV